MGGERFSEYNPRIKDGGVSLDDLKLLDGKVVKFVPNGNRFESDGRNIAMIGLVSLKEIVSGKETGSNNPELKINWQNNNIGTSGGVTTKTGRDNIEIFLRGIYSIEEVTETEDANFS